MEATNKEVIFTRPHKTIYATEDKTSKYLITAIPRLMY